MVVFMKKFLLILVSPFVSLFSECDFSQFDRFQDKWTREEIEHKLGTYLQKDGRVSSFFTLSDQAFVLYDAPDTQKERSVEYTLRLAPKKERRVLEQKKRGNLVGVKVALDPGHFGGPYSRLEQRFIDIPPSLDRAEHIQFDEGTINLLTALYLKVLLEKEGAIVMITRDQIGKGVYKEDFFDWLKNCPSLWAKEGSLMTLFRKYYYPLDLCARAEKINAFDPELTLILHYNAHHIEEVYSSNNCVASHNYNMVFIPGAFCRNELAMQESRFEFLRLLVSEDLENSLKLSSSILQELSHSLKVPTVSPSDGARYLNNVCLKVGEGIYSRNLALTRLIHSPVCYGETLVQNNIDECQNLNRTDFIIGGQKCSSRVKQVAEAYFEGIKRYLVVE